MCILGDIKKDPTYYEMALESSNNRSLRALRSLGTYYFSLKDFDKA